MIRKLVATVLVVSGTLTLAVTGSAPVAAAELQEATWWSRLATQDPLSESPQALPFPNPELPAPAPDPSVPDGQLLVQGTAEGAVAIATIHWTLQDGESHPSLTLPIGPGSTVTPESVILACRTATEWDEPEARPGRWETKPAVDGRSCINGAIEPDLSAVSFGLQPLVRGTRLDITLVPGQVAELPAGANGSVFRWVFADPPPEAMEAIDSGFRLGADPVVVTLPESTGSGSSTASVAASPDSTEALPPATPPTTERVDATSLVAAPVLEPEDLASADAPLTASPASLTGDETSRTVGAVLLLLGLLAAAWSWLSPAPAEHATIGLGRFRRAAPDLLPTPAAPPVPLVGGLGRFAKERTEPPVPVV